ncbi:uncharacterized protein [Antedon mediterranea]|uniref:uncharacterized protein n=1 Tax=Antedon mediterranea TaxID=105859 RepID=UPI003AF4C446
MSNYNNISGHSIQDAQQNNNNSAGTCCILVTQPNECHGSLQRQNSFENESPSDKTTSVEERRQHFRSVSSGRGSGSAEVSQDESVLGASVESGYSGNNRRRSSTFLDVNFIAEEGKNERLHENTTEVNQNEKPSNGRKRSRTDSFENPSKIQKMYKYKPEIAQYNQKITESIGVMKRKDQKFCSADLQQLKSTVERWDRYGTSSHRKVLHDCETEISKAEKSEVILSSKKEITGDKEANPDNHVELESSDSFELDEKDLKEVHELNRQVSNISRIQHEESIKAASEYLDDPIYTSQEFNRQVSNISSIQHEESIEVNASFLDDPPLDTAQHGVDGLGFNNVKCCQMECLHLKSLCKVQNCIEQQCNQVHTVITHLKMCLSNGVPCMKCNRVVSLFYHHSKICEEFKCPVPFCNFFKQYSGITEDHSLAKLYTIFEKKVLLMTVLEFGWLREEHDYEWKGQDFDDIWTKRDTKKLYLLNDFLQEPCGFGIFTTVQFMVNCSVPYAIKHFCVSKENRDEIKNILSTVNQNRLPQIAYHLWYRVNDNAGYICTSLVKGGSLKSLINSGSTQDIKTLENNRLSYIDQACMVAVHLRDLRIILLDWSSDHISLDVTRQRMIFHDFSSAVLLDSTKRYTSNDKKQLRPHLTPTEVCKKQFRTRQSDVWGVGTLTYELFHKKTLFFALSHEHPEVVRNKIGCGYKPDFEWCKNDQSLQSFLIHSLAEDPEDRIVMLDARTHCIFYKKSPIHVNFLKQNLH